MTFRWSTLTRCAARDSLVGMSGDERSVLLDCLDWDISRVDEIRASGRLDDTQNAQLNGLREHLDTYKQFLVGVD